MLQEFTEIDILGWVLDFTSCFVLPRESCYHDQIDFITIAINAKTYQIHRPLVRKIHYVVKNLQTFVCGAGFVVFDEYYIRLIIYIAPVNR